MLVKLTFNIDAALNAIPLQKVVHGWSTSHSHYNQAMNQILTTIDQLRVSDAAKREMLMETMTNAATAILNGASLKESLNAISSEKWIDLIKPAQLNI